MSDRVCRFCRYCDGEAPKLSSVNASRITISSGSGMCRRHAPSPTYGEEEWVLWPMVDLSDDWCGDFQLTEEPVFWWERSKPEDECVTYMYGNGDMRVPVGRVWDVPKEVKELGEESYRAVKMDGIGNEAEFFQNLHDAVAWVVDVEG